MFIFVADSLLLAAQLLTGLALLLAPCAVGYWLARIYQKRKEARARRSAAARWLDDVLND